MFLLTQAALKDVDPSLEEAARGLGAGRARTVLRVTLPAARPGAAAGALLVALYVLSDFGVVSLMRYEALTRAIFLQYRSLFDRTPAAVLSLVLVGLTAWSSPSSGASAQAADATGSRRVQRVVPGRSPWAAGGGRHSRGARRSSVRSSRCRPRYWPPGSSGASATTPT